jgi:hypothetical protein
MIATVSVVGNVGLVGDFEPHATAVSVETAQQTTSA